MNSGGKQLIKTRKRMTTKQEFITVFGTEFLAVIDKNCANVV